MKQYGYVRVSTNGQNIDRQMTAMYNEKIPKNQIYIDKKSGKDFDRKAYKKMLNKLKKGDTVFVKSIDRLGRNYDEVIEQWKILTTDKDVDIVVIDFPLLDTRNQVNGLTGKLISGLVLQVLSYVAEVERENTKQRQAEGILEAKKKGIQFGRPKRAKPDGYEEVLKLWEQGEISQKEAGRRLEVSHHTFVKWATMI